MVRSLLRVLGVVIALLLFVTVLLTVRALRLPSRQVSVPPAPARVVAADIAARHLAEAIRIPTLSYTSDPEDLQAGAFVAFAAWLAETYPRLHESLTLERVSEHSLV